MTSHTFGSSRNGLEDEKRNVSRTEHEFSTKQKTFVNYDSKTSFFQELLFLVEVTFK